MNERSPSEPKGSSLRTRLREATSLAILEAAEEVFADKGLIAAHMNDIASSAGVAVGTLYNHFEDRDALLSSLLELRRGGLLELMDEFLDQPSSGSFEDDLRTLVHRMGGYFEQHRRFHTILHRMEHGVNQAHYPSCAESAPTSRRAMHLRLEKLIRRGLEQKALRPELAEYYPVLLLGILRSMRLHLQDNNLDGRLPLEEAIHFFMKGAGA
jgi:AcrR family transcriptional regulator